MITLFWVYLGLMVGSALAAFSLTIVDGFNAHNDPHSNERHRLVTRTLFMSRVDERLQVSKFRLPDQV